jgi:predicted transposase YbfD/YdcC
MCYLAYMNIQKLIEQAQNINDPRRQYGYLQHKLVTIMIISFCAIICGAEDYEDIEEFGKVRKDWLKQFLELPNGIPDKDTFRRVFERLNPSEVAECLYSWLGNSSCNGQTVNIDGKTICGSQNMAHKAYHVVSAWVSESQITLGEIVVDEKSNEITAIPKLLDLVDVSGSTITIDAMGCQKNIAAAIIEQGADYILALKGNQGNLLEQTQDSFRFLEVDSVSVEVDADHGRVETRTCSVISDLSMIENASDWKALKILVRIVAERYFKSTGKTERETRYYIASLRPDAELLNRSVRSHWGIENKLHWSLDIAFNEDYSRKRAGYAAQNFSTLCRIALNLLKKDTATKCGIKTKRLKAGWDNDYLLELLEN